MPEVGKTYELRDPYGLVEVTALDEVWIHIKRENEAERELMGTPKRVGKTTNLDRIKRKHWANKVVK